MALEDYVVDSSNSLARRYGILDHDARKAKEAKENRSRRPADLYDNEGEDDHKSTSRPVRTPQPFKPDPGNRTPPFLMVDNDLLARTDLSSDAKLVYAYLKNIQRLSNGGSICPRQTTMIEALGLTKYLVPKALVDLEDAKLITRHRKGPSGLTHYTLL